MKLSDYDYELPDNLIASVPPKIRGQSRLLVLDRSTGTINASTYPDVVNYLSTGDVLIINDTKVIKARLDTTKANGAKRELIILEKHGHTTDWHHHKVMYRGKLTKGDQLSVGEEVKLTVSEILGDGLAIISSSEDLLELADKYGSVPLPPYMHRNATEQDSLRYQTVWAADAGSVAAPTASLNMTDETLQKLKDKGIKIVKLTLHVGLGTFMPIRTDNVEDHKMHQEYFEIPAETVDAIRNAKNKGNKIVALGTTVARTLEYAADQLPGATRQITGEADIFIYPGYKFKVINGLLTNFHAPHSTVLMLTAAFAGWDKLLPAYKHAVSQSYKFFSYGDSMLIMDSPHEK